MSYARGRSTPKRLVERASIILRAADGQQDREIGQALRIGRRTVARWRARFLSLGIAGIEKDAPRRGRSRKVSAAAILEATAKIRPSGDRWSTRSMAQALGISEASVRRVWRAHGVTPHRIRFCDFSTAPRFLRTINDVTALHLELPAFVIAFSTEARTAPLPSPASRHAVVAANAETGAILLELARLSDCGRWHARTPSAEFDWLGFLQSAQRRTPRNQRLHVVAAGYDPGGCPGIASWLERHRRCEIHMASAGICWISLIRMCLDSRKRISSPIFRALPELLQSLERHVANPNLPGPFSWIASRLMDYA